ncbi:MAG: hypothetical protein R6W71_07220, partial [Bacteroidales bacterium]
MEKMKILMAAATILIAGAIFHSCQKENVQPVKEQGTMVVKDVSAGDYFTYSENPLCFGEEVIVTFDNTQGHDHSNFQMHVWGPEGSIYVSFDDEGDPTWYNVTTFLSEPSGGKVTFTFEPDVVGEYRFRGQWVRTGNPKKYPGTSTGWQEATPELLVEICGCDHEMTGETFCGSYEYPEGS